MRSESQPAFLHSQGQSCEFERALATSVFHPRTDGLRRDSEPLGR
jgi:hypothetical protein